MSRNPVQEEGSKAPLEEDGAPGDEVGDGLSLFLASVPRESTPQLLDLLHCNGMPAT